MNQEVYAIRERGTDRYLPALKRGRVRTRGFSHDEPVTGPPRLFHEVRAECFDREASRDVGERHHIQAAGITRTLMFTRSRPRISKLLRGTGPVGSNVSRFRNDAKPAATVRP
jgi:hypothetical protein